MIIKLTYEVGDVIERNGDTDVVYEITINIAEDGWEALYWNEKYDWPIYREGTVNRP